VIKEPSLEVGALLFIRAENILVCASNHPLVKTFLSATAIQQLWEMGVGLQTTASSSFGGAVLREC
jgi:hypothetical protein